jgi:hypothetical protein
MQHHSTLLTFGGFQFSPGAVAFSSSLFAFRRQPFAEPPPRPFVGSSEGNVTISLEGFNFGNDIHKLEVTLSSNIAGELLLCAVVVARGFTPVQDGADGVKKEEEKGAHSDDKGVESRKQRIYCVVPRGDAGEFMGAQITVRGVVEWYVLQVLL